MRSDYRTLKEFIRAVKEKNKDLLCSELLGINIDKYFMPSVANVVGTNMANYKIVKPGQFSCNRMHVGRDYRIPIALSDKKEPFIVSPAYDVFEITNTNELLPDYLMMWFSRKEFDRNAWFHTDGDVRGGLAWEAFCNLELPVPSINTQREIVKEYKAVENRIRLNEQFIQKLEETVQAIYREWFLEFENNDMVFLREYVETNPNLELRKGEISAYVEMANLSEVSMCINGKAKREYQGGSRFQNNDTLLARITPCLENGKTAFVNILKENETAAGSTEFIVMRGKNKVSPFWVYCIAKDERFRAYAISSMVGSSGRQRVHEKYLEEYMLPKINNEQMDRFDRTAKPIFEMISFKSKENQKLTELKELLLSRLATKKI
jgi:type I restriction enzyme, S subunit